MRRGLILLVAVVLAMLPVTPGATGAASLCLKYDRLATYGSSPTASASKAVKARDKGVDFYTALPLDGPPSIDHVYPLHAAWPVACKWEKAQRRKFANDTFNLVLTTRSLNSAKGDFTPSGWAPSNRKRACEYATLYEKVAAKYDLPVSKADTTARKMSCAA